jgi:hypothetical protein
MLPGDAAGGEEDGVDRADVVVLGVHAHHHGEKDQVSETEPAPRLSLWIAQKPDEARDPDQRGKRVQIAQLGTEEWERGKFDVLVVKLTVAQELKRGPVIVDLPNQVRQRDKDKQRNAGRGPFAGQQAARGSDQQRGEQAEEEEGQRRLIKQTKPAGEAEPKPEALGCSAANEDQRQ